MRNKKVAFIVPYPYGIAPGQRFRYEQYLDTLKQEGYSITIHSFFSLKAYQLLYTSSNFSRLLYTLYGYLKRIGQLFTLFQYDFIFLFREASPLGPPVFEWLIAKVLRKKIIYDFDDAIWLPQYQDKPRFLDKLRNPSKVNQIIKWSWKISCGNAYLAQQARKYNNNVVVNPTTIDTEHLHNRIKNQQTKKLVIGWTGTHSTLMYLEPLIPIVRKLEEKYEFELVVIANQEPDFTCKSLRFVLWNKDTEIADLLQMNVGIMPLLDDAWTRGKCGFKALQYMALGIPAVVSPVGVNNDIIQQGINGYLCNTDEEWCSAFEALLKDPDLRVQLGKAARTTVEERYSVKSNTENFLNLFAKS